MEKSDYSNLYEAFLKEYDQERKKEAWTSQSNKFREFWKNVMLADTKKELNDQEIDEIVRILDRYGKGNTKESEAIGRVRIDQGTWRRMFKEIHSNKELSMIMTAILTEEDIDKRASNINKLYEVNKERKNSLTGQSGNAINAFIAAYDPFENLSIVSLKDRLKLISYFGFLNSLDMGNSSIGERITKTNKIIMDGFARIGITGSARFISEFCYYEPVRSLWKGLETFETKGSIVTVPEHEIEQESPKSQAESSTHDEIQYLLLKLGSDVGLDVWVAKNDLSKGYNGITFKDLPKLKKVLPRQFDEATNRTIEKIDVLWLQGDAIIGAFEIEHTTAIYSGILRMADLISMQPNIKINLYIVAPDERRDKVFEEINRPVFAKLKPPLPKICRFISYSKLKKEIENIRSYTEYLKPEFIEKIAESCEPDEA